MEKSLVNEKSSHFPIPIELPRTDLVYTTMLLCITARQCWKPLMLFMRHFVCECGGGGDHFFCPPSFPFRYVTTFVIGRLQLKLAGVSILLLETLYPKESQGEKEDMQA